MVRQVKPQTKAPELPKFGDRIPAERFHVSKLNVRADEKFGESEEDKLLIENLRRGKTVQPFKARPEAKGFGIYVGRRRFLAKKEVGTKAFVVGQDVLIEQISDEEANEQSLIENLTLLREEMNPLLRARKVQDLIDHNLAGLRAEAARLGIGASTLSEWTSILKLTPPMQEAIQKGQVSFYEGLRVARLKPGQIEEEKLAKAAGDGKEAFFAELDKAQSGQAKRGIPAGKFWVVRLMYPRADQEGKYDKLSRAAKARNMTNDEFVMWAVDKELKNF